MVFIDHSQSNDMCWQRDPSPLSSEEWDKPVTDQQAQAKLLLTHVGLFWFLCKQQSSAEQSNSVINLANSDWVGH